MKKKAVKEAIGIPEIATDFVLVLRTCNADMRSYGGFTWPTSGPVSAPDWSSAPVCGSGLHGLLWGEGDGKHLEFGDESKWLVCRVAANQVVDLGGKVKFPSCEVIHCGNQKSATEFIYARGAVGRAVVGGTATAGYSGTAKAGYSGTATAGDRGTATAGDSGTATAGDSGTATAGYRGTATAGIAGVIAILYWNGKRYKTRIGQVKDEDGDGDLEPNTPYKINSAGDFIPCALHTKWETCGIRGLRQILCSRFVGRIPVIAQSVRSGITGLLLYRRERMTGEEIDPLPQTLDELCDYIEAHADAIYVRAQIDGKWGTCSLTKLPAKLAIIHALRFIRRRQVPVFVRGREGDYE